MSRTHYADLLRCRFGRLKVVEMLDDRICGHVVWLCRCRCGSIVAVVGSNLTTGNTLSCGCWQREISRRPSALRREYADGGTEETQR